MPFSIKRKGEITVVDATVTDVLKQKEEKIATKYKKKAGFLAD